MAPMYRVICVVALLATGGGGGGGIPHIAMPSTRCHKVYSRHSVGVVLGQRRRQLTGIELAMGCDAGPTLHRNRVGRPTSCVRGTS